MYIYPDEDECLTEGHLYLLHANMLYPSELDKLDTHCAWCETCDDLRFNFETVYSVRHQHLTMIELEILSTMRLDALSDVDGCRLCRVRYAFATLSRKESRQS